MTINAETMKKYLQMQVENGTGSDGTTKYVNRSYGLKTSAADDKVYEVATAIASLMEKPYRCIRVVNTVELDEQ